MTQETVKALSDGALAQVIIWAQTEVKERAEKRKEETIARIKELAGSVGISVTVGGMRGRPPRRTKAAIPAKSAGKSA